MTSTRCLQAVILLGAFGIAALPAGADSVQLANGDVLNGHVLGLDETQLRLESDTFGQVNIPRAKIVTITLGDKSAAIPAKASKAGAAPTGPTPEDVIKQLQASGVNPKDLGEIQKMLPLLATPEASKHFSDTVNGLLGGTLSVGDIRKEAIRARDELKKATKGLGPDVDAGLAPYLRILEKFIDETQPPASSGKAQREAPPVKK